MHLHHPRMLYNLVNIVQRSPLADHNRVIDSLLEDRHQQQQRWNQEHEGQHQATDKSCHRLSAAQRLDQPHMSGKRQHTDQYRQDNRLHKWLDQPIAGVQCNRQENQQHQTIGAPFKQGLHNFFPLSGVISESNKYRLRRNDVAVPLVARNRRAQ